MDLTRVWFRVTCLTQGIKNRNSVSNRVGKAAIFVLNIMSRVPPPLPPWDVEPETYERTRLRGLMFQKSRYTLRKKGDCSALTVWREPLPGTSSVYSRVNRSYLPSYRERPVQHNQHIDKPEIIFVNSLTPEHKGISCFSRVSQDKHEFTATGSRCRWYGRSQYL